MARDWGVTDRLVESRPDWSGPLWELLALPGDLVVIAIVIGLIGLWELNRGIREGTETDPLVAPQFGALVGIVFGGLALIVLLEAAIAAPRPPAEWHAIEPSPYGFPSGHVMAATILWGAIGGVYWRNRSSWIRLTAIGVVVGVVAISRLMLGVHYLPDVLAGIAIGSLFVVITVLVLSSRPWGSLGMAVGIGILAVFVATNTRAGLALAGAVMATAGWWVIERTSIRRAVRNLVMFAER